MCVCSGAGAGVIRPELLESRQRVGDQPTERVPQPAAWADQSEGRDEQDQQPPERSEYSSLLRSRPALHRSLLIPLSVLKDLRALLLVLSVYAPQQLDPALGPALQELLSKCRLCLQHRATLEMEAKERKVKGVNITNTLKSHYFI